MSDKRSKTQQGDFFTAASLAAAAGVSGVYVARLCKQGKIPCKKLHPQVWLIAFADGQAWLAEREAKRQHLNPTP